MSWETLITGKIKLENATDDDITLIQDTLEFGNEVEKVDIATIQSTTLVDFCSVNWGSHIDEDKINELIEKLKPKLTYYAITLYYLAPDFDTPNWYYNGEKKNELQ
jgi:hypothetical protein